MNIEYFINKEDMNNRINYLLDGTAKMVVECDGEKAKIYHMSNHIMYRLIGCPGVDIHLIDDNIEEHAIIPCLSHADAVDMEKRVLEYYAFVKD